MTWTQDKIAALEQRWQAGESITAIGKALGTSRNAVVGKAHRLGLPSRVSPIRRRDAKPASAQAVQP
jgi:GcrA cell cycle regulator